MKTLTAKNVSEIFFDCLFRDGEDTSTAKTVDGVLSKFGFHPARLETHREAIGELLSCLPNEFRSDKDGGWSFLQACMTKDGNQWGEHSKIEQLLVLGIATEQARILMPREMWKLFPGSMPYFSVTPKTSPLTHAATVPN